MENLDVTRLVNIASGGNFFPVGDVVDRHNYPEPMFPFEDQRFNDYVKVVGEFGGHGPCRPRSPMGFRDAELGIWRFADYQRGIQTAISTLV